MAYTLNRRLAELIDSSGQLNTGKIANGYISTDHFANNSITQGKLHSTFVLPSSALSGVNTDSVSEGSTNIYFTNARADARADTRIAAATTDDLSEGSSNLYYTDARADARVALIVDSAPGTLNTLNELAAALGDDANFSTTVTNSIATKLPLAGGTMTGALNMGSQNITNAGTIASGAITSSAQLTSNGGGVNVNGGTGNAYVSIGSDTGNWVWKNYRATHKLALEDSDGTGEVLNFDTSGNATFAGDVRGGAFSVGAGPTSELLFLSGAGHNGHGTTNARSVASFNATGQNAGLWFGARNDETTGIIGTRTATGNLAFETYSGSWDERMRITYDGKVGIGTDSPDYTLEVVGDSMIGDASAVTSPAFAAQQQIVKSFTYGAHGAGRGGNLYLLNTNTGGDSGLITFGGYSNHTNNLYYQTGGIGGGTEAQDGGSWGGYLSFITTSDGSKGSASGMYEHMRITGDGHIQIKQTGSAPTNSVMLPGHIEFKGQGWDSNSGSDDMNIKIEMAATYGKVGSGATSPELVFSLQGAGGLDSSSEAYVEGMRLVGAGAYNNNAPRLGIGTASPSKTLDVYTAVNTGGIQITGGSSATNTSLHINNTGSGGVNWNITSTGGGHGYGEGQLHFGVAYAVPKMRITSSGNVGIGHAVGSHTPQKVLEVECPSEDFITLGARTLGNTSNWAGIHFGYKENNLNYRKSAIIFERTDRYSNNAQGKVHILNGPVSGAGSATLLDAKFTIDEDGNVGIGKTAPERKLHIVGDSTSHGQYPLGLDATNTDYTLEFRRNGNSEWWIAQSASAFRIHENGVADMFRINATDGNIVLGRTRGTDTETSYTQQTFQFPLDAHVNGADEAAEEKDAVFSKIWRKSAILHPGQYSNGNYYVGIGVTASASVSYVVFKLNVDKATELFASTFVSNSADGTTRANKIYYSLDDENWTLLQSENWSAGGNTCSSTLSLSSHAGSSGGFFTGTVFLKFAIEGTGSSHTNLIGWQEFNIRARAQHASLTGGGFQRSKNDLTLSGNSNTGHGYAPLLHAYSHQFTGQNGAGIVASNGGTQTFISQGLGYLDRAIFDITTNASHGANGIQVMRSGVLTCQFLQDIITTNTSGYLSCTVRRYNEALTASKVVCQTLRTHTDGSWDMIQGAFACDVVAGDIITFTFAAASASSMDNGSWSHYIMTITPTATTSYGNAATNLPWVNQ